MKLIPVSSGDFQWIDGAPLTLGFKFTEIDVLVTAHGEDDRLHARKTKVTRQPNKWCEFHPAKQF